LWSNKTAENIDTALFTRQQLAKKFGDQGINYYKSAMGRDYSCAFDYACMAQPSFQQDGSTCVADDTCTPAIAAGYDVGAVPGYIFGTEYGTDRFHGVGKNKTMFVSDLFVQANLTQVETDAAWSNGVVVDKWNVSAVTMRTENCNDPNPANRGIDCKSPIGTINVGYNSMYASGKTPLIGWIPYYMSFPYFDLLVKDGERSPEAYYPADRSKLIFHTCDSCPADRDFNTYLWTDPQTGLHLNGNQRIQMSVRVTADPNAVSANPALAAESAPAPTSVFLNSTLDTTIPIYWLNKYDQAAGFQLDSIAFVQGAPALLNVVFWVGLFVGLLLIAAGGVLLWFGLRLKRSASQILLMERSTDGSEEKPRIATIDEQTTERV
jgi:hypothetical protein